jgi:ferric-dicitrate binding protein FerR (iron transport regulator)
MREEPKAMRPSIVEIFTALERTRRCAQAWAQSNPEHDEALEKFITDLDQIGCELKSSVPVKARFRSARHGSTVEGNMFGILNCLIPVITFAVIISERQPEYTVPLKRFYEEVRRVQQELIKKVQVGSGVFSDED